MAVGCLVGDGGCRSRVARACCVALSFVVCSTMVSLPAGAAVSRTPNFVVTASTRTLAIRVASAAEVHRRELAVRWLGHEMPRWSSPCRVLVRPNRPRAAGATTFSFRRGEVFGWQMTLEGPDDEVLESIAVVGPRQEIAARLEARLEGIADGVSLTHNRAPDPGHWADIVASLKGN